MPVARFQLPDGRIARFEVAEGTSPEEAQAEIEKHLSGAPQAQPKAESPPTNAEMLAGNPLIRFALGAASPILGAAQFGAELLGDKSGTDTLKQLDEMKRRGMSPEADVIRLKESRAVLSKLPGYEEVIKRLDEAIAERGKETGSGVDLSGLAGSVLSPPVLAAMKIPAAGSVLGRAGQGVAIGGGLAATSPVTSGDDFWTSKAAQVGTGMAIGGAIPPAIDAGKKLYEVARRILDPLLPGGASRSAARLIAESAGTKRPEIEKLLGEEKQLVQGSVPTAAEAAAPAGSAEFSALQTIARERRPTEFSDLAKAQETAREKAIQGIGKTKEDVERAIAARGSAAEQNYGSVRAFLVRQNEELEKLLSRPSMEKAIVRARQLAEEKGQQFQVGMNRPAQEIPSRILNAEGQPASVSAVPEELARYPVQSLHNVKMALDDMVKNPERFGIGASEVGAISRTRNELVKWIEGKAPLYERARETYAAMSKPINEMQVGQGLERALKKPIGEGERPGVFATAMREEPRTIKKATGQPRYEELEDVLSPENLATAKGILADLSRKAEQESLARLGRARAGEITTAFTLPAAGPLERGYVIFKTILGRVSKGVTEKTLDEVSKALQVPSATLKLLQSVPDAQRQKVIDQIIAQKLGRGAIAAASQVSGEVTQQ